MTDTSTERDTGSTTPDDPGKQPRRSGAGRIGLLGGLRYVWTQLTTMRTALGLLFLLALAAIPGTLVPQRTISPVEVDAFIEQHPTLGPIYDQVGLFNVYTSPWFSAVYLLLFLSLIGCIVPRVGVYARAVRAQPPKTPRYLHRLPAYHRTELSETVRAGAPADSDNSVMERAAAALRSKRYRVAVQPDGSVSAERGYLREAGNLVFHISMVVLLIGVAVVWMTNFRGTSSVVVGSGFSNNLAQYDDFSAGPTFTGARLAPFTLQVDNFHVAFETGDVQRGAAREFRVDLTVFDRPGAEPRQESIKVNHPLRIGHNTVHLVAWGYAPVVTVKDGNGDVAYSGPVIFLPQDGNFTSAGAIKAPDARPKRLGFEGIFLPSGYLDPERGPRSVFPDDLNPQLYLNAWSGPPREETGVPESVYSLNTKGMDQIMDPNDPEQPMRFILRPGYVQKLPNGQGSIQLDGVQHWVKLQVSSTPGVWIAVGAIGTAVTGLCFSLFIRPRRVWARLRTTNGSTVFEVGGLDRADARTGLDDDVAALAADLGLSEAGSPEAGSSEAGSSEAGSSAAGSSEAGEPKEPTDGR